MKLSDHWKVLRYVAANWSTFMFFGDVADVHKKGLVEIDKIINPQFYFDDYAFEPADTSIARVGLVLEETLRPEHFFSGGESMQPGLVTDYVPKKARS